MSRQLLVLDTFHVENSKGGIVIEPIEGARQALDKLSKQFRFVAVSSRSSIQQDQTLLWLTAVFGQVFESVHCIDSKHTGLSKGDFCKELGASYLIDDNIEHCKTAAEVGVTPILFGSYGWQVKSVKNMSFHRCRNWSEVLEYFDGRG